jgi:hypothetical protein
MTDLMAQVTLKELEDRNQCNLNGKLVAYIQEERLVSPPH